MQRNTVNGTQKRKERQLSSWFFIVFFFRLPIHIKSDISKASVGGTFSKIVKHFLRFVKTLSFTVEVSHFYVKCHRGHKSINYLPGAYVGYPVSQSVQ